MSSPEPPETRYEGADRPAPGAGTVHEGVTTPGHAGAGAAGTVHESVGHGAATTYEDTALASGRRRRLQLPDPILESFEYVRDLNAGSQADVVLCRERTTGREVAIKLYRSDLSSVDLDAIETARTADPAHAVPISDLRSWQGETWEVQEYFPLGSLQDLFLQNQEPVAPEVCRAILDELVDAVEHIHWLGIVHRDLKPANVLVRAWEPTTDLVLADFGVARAQAASRVAGSLAGTIAYMAPEAQAHQTGRPGDWWGVGVIMAEALSGRHLFADPASTDGRLLPEAVIQGFLHYGTYQVPELPDERWDLLVRGLLTKDDTNRWDAEQVRAWQRGESPAVARATGVGTSSRPMVQSFVFDGRAHHEPAELARSFRTRSVAAGDLIADPRARERLRMWLTTHGLGDVASSVLSGSPSPGPATVQLQAVMDPATAPVYRSVSLTPRALMDRARSAAEGDEDAVTWIRQLREEQILSELGSFSADAEELGAADERLRTWWRRIDLTPAGERQLVADVLAPGEGLLLLTALDASARSSQERSNATALSQLGRVSDRFGEAARRVAEDTSDESFGLRTLFAVQHRAEVAEERARRATRAAETKDRRREGRKANVRQGIRTLRLPLGTTVVAMVVLAGILSWDSDFVRAGLDLLPWAAVPVVLQAVLSSFGHRERADARWAVWVVSVPWLAQEATEKVRPAISGYGDVDPTLWHLPFVVVTLGVLADWCGGFLPPKPTTAARQRRWSAVMNGSIALTTVVIVSYLIQVAYPTRVARAISDAPDFYFSVAYELDGNLASLRDAQPNWLLPTGAWCLLALALLAAVALPAPKVSTASQGAVRALLVLAMLLVVTANAGLVWPLVFAVGAVVAIVVGGILGVVLVFWVLIGIASS
jgi:hypothetical protein